MCSILPAIIIALLCPRCECQACEAQDRGAFTIRDYRGRVVEVEPSTAGGAPSHPAPEEGTVWSPLQEASSDKVGS